MLKMETANTTTIMCVRTCGYQVDKGEFMQCGYCRALFYQPYLVLVQ